MNLDLLKRIVIEIPLVQVAVFAGICTLVALTGKFKFLLICIYAAILYWVFLLNEAKFSFSGDVGVIHTGLFVLTSIIFIAFGAWIFFIEK